MIAVRNPAVCVTENLPSKIQETVHVARMKNCCGRLGCAEVTLKGLDLADPTTTKYEVVEKIVDTYKSGRDFWQLQ